MTKMFGEFLVEKGILSRDDLLEALVDQIKRTPPIAEVVLNEKLVDGDKLLQAMKLQVTKDLGLLAALDQVGVLTAKAKARVEQVVKNARVPLGQILIEKNKLDFQALIHALDDFVYENAGKIEAPDGAGFASSQAAEIPKAEEKLEVRAKAADDSLGHGGQASKVQSRSGDDYFSPALIKIDEGLLEQFLETFNSCNLDQMVEHCSIADHETALMDMLSELLAASRFVRAEVVERLVCVLLLGLKDSKVKDEDLKLGLELIARLRDSIKSTSSERQFWGDKQQQGQYLDLVHQLEAA